MRKRSELPWRPFLNADTGFIKAVKWVAFAARIGEEDFSIRTALLEAPGVEVYPMIALDCQTGPGQWFKKVIYHNDAWMRVIGDNTRLLADDTPDFDLYEQDREKIQLAVTKYVVRLTM